MNERTIPQILDDTARRLGDQPALRQPLLKNGPRQYQTYTWNDYKRAAEEIAAGLRSLGIGKGDVVVLDSETRAEFYLSDLGILMNGSISAALYPSYPPEELIRMIHACDAKAVFVEDGATRKRLRGARIGCWIQLTGEPEDAMSLGRLREEGRRALEQNAGLLNEIKEGVAPSDPAILYLTSGTTSEPKMALVTHSAVVANIEMAPEVLPLGPADETVAFLPSAHIAQRIVMELVPLRLGIPVTFSESLMKLPQDIKSVRPTFFLAPPRMWERIHSSINLELRKRPAYVQKLFQYALASGRKAASYRREGRPVPLGVRLALKMADAFILRKVRERFGGRLRIRLSGAAPLSRHLAEFYEAIGMPLVEGYGLTEAGVVALNPVDRPKPGSIGKALPGVAVRIAEDGELLVKTPCHLLTYYHDIELTTEVLRGGWLHTGDLAEVDGEGYIFITGRKKELIVSSTGKKVYPNRVEALLLSEALINQVVLVGDRLPYLIAVFTINVGIARRLQGMEARTTDSLEEIAAAEPVRAEVRKLVENANRQLAPFEQIRKHYILPREFRMEDGELTPTMKIRRTRVLENLRDEIASLYNADLKAV